MVPDNAELHRPCVFTLLLFRVLNRLVVCHFLSAPLCYETLNLRTCSVYFLSVFLQDIFGVRMNGQPFRLNFSDRNFFSSALRSAYSQFMQHRCNVFTVLTNEINFPNVIKLYEEYYVVNLKNEWPQRNFSHELHVKSFTVACFLYSYLFIYLFPYFFKLI